MGIVTGRKLALPLHQARKGFSLLIRSPCSLHVSEGQKCRQGRPLSPSCKGQNRDAAWADGPKGACNHFDTSPQDLEKREKSELGRVALLRMAAALGLLESWVQHCRVPPPSDPLGREAPGKESSRDKNSIKARELRTCGRDAGNLSTDSRVSL